MEEPGDFCSDQSVNDTNTSVVIGDAYILSKNDSSVRDGIINFEPSRLLFWFGTVEVVLSALGLFGNLVSLWVWQASTSFNATTFLFKCLSTWHSAFLVAVIFFVKNMYQPADSLLALIVFHSGNFSQSMSMHTTLLVAVSRWVAVRYPLHARRLLTRRHVWLSCLLIFLWSALLEGVYVAVRVLFYQWWLGETKKAIGLILPLLILLLFNISLLRTVHRRKELNKGLCATPHSREEGTASFGKPITVVCLDNIPSKDTVLDAADHLQNRALVESTDIGIPTESPKTPPKRPDNADAITANQHVSHHRCPRQVSLNKESKRYQVTATVLCVSLSSFIAYPVGITAQVLAKQDTESPVLSALLGHVAFLFQIINSGINIVFYAALVSNFRQLARLRVSSCQRVCSK